MAQLPVPVDERWLTGYVQCQACGVRWMAVRPIQTVYLECPSCHVMTAAGREQESKNDERP